MSAEIMMQDLRNALAELYISGLRMPRHTPNPGGASTVHCYQLSAAHVWNQDRAMEKAAKLLGITDVPHACCVGARNFDEEVAERLEENARMILRC